MHRTPIGTGTVGRDRDAPTRTAQTGDAVVEHDAIERQSVRGGERGERRVGQRFDSRRAAPARRGRRCSLAATEIDAPASSRPSPMK